ncbi:cyclin [Halobacteriales archaeon SW_7_68_16]|nr:MAG: cyclin [Halobacteriales archaeon SW_7_68_16]
MHRASDQVEHEVWIAEIEAAAERLDLGTQARSYAVELFLSDVPESDRSKRATMAASVYAASLIAGERRSQTRVAEACDVSRLTIQSRWKGLIDDAGLSPPSW